jgi:hypothetical protein
MTSPDLVSIWYSPLPEDRASEGSASQEYANRIHATWSIRQRSLKINEPMLLDPDTLFSNHNNNNNNNNDVKQQQQQQQQQRHVMMFVISCAADGSVHRSVRKVMRVLKNHHPQKNNTNQQEQPEQNNNTQREESSSESPSLLPQQQQQQQVVVVAVALLGHARCENSANQMKDTIFGTGRRFVSAWSSPTATTTTTTEIVRRELATTSTSTTCETQAELEGPEKVFDPWVESLFQEFYPETRNNN